MIYRITTNTIDTILTLDTILINNTYNSVTAVWARARDPKRVDVILNSTKILTIVIVKIS